MCTLDIFAFVCHVIGNLFGEERIMVHTNRWDPRLNYPGSMGVVLRLRLYLNEYLSDLHVFCIRI